MWDWICYKKRLLLLQVGLDTNDVVAPTCIWLSLTVTITICHSGHILPCLDWGMGEIQIVLMCLVGIGVGGFYETLSSSPTGNIYFDQQLWPSFGKWLFIDMFEIMTKINQWFNHSNSIWHLLFFKRTPNNPYSVIKVHFGQIWVKMVMVGRLGLNQWFSA